MSATITSTLDDLKARLAGLGIPVDAPLPEPVAPTSAPKTPTFETGAPAVAVDRNSLPLDDRPATDNQVAFIKRLASERGVRFTQGGKPIAELSTTTPGFTNRRVQQVIEYLKAQPVNASEIVPSVRRNRLPQDCTECGVEVPAQEGELTHEDGHWVVRHHGGCPEVKSPYTAELERIQNSYDLVDPALDLSDLLDGNYADPTSAGDLKIEVRRGEDDFEGLIYVSDAAVYGWHSEYGVQIPDSTYRGKVAGHLAAIVADPIGAAARYGQLTSSCGICGRALEDGKPNGSDGLSSLERGIGPVCWKKLQG